MNVSRVFKMYHENFFFSLTSRLTIKKELAYRAIPIPTDNIALRYVDNTPVPIPSTK